MRAHDHAGFGASSDDPDSFERRHAVPSLSNNDGACVV
jgi:hypothetical protein